MESASFVVQSEGADVVTEHDNQIWTNPYHVFEKNTQQLWAYPRASINSRNVFNDKPTNVVGYDWKVSDFKQSVNSYFVFNKVVGANQKTRTLPDGTIKLVTDEDNGIVEKTTTTLEDQIVVLEDTDYNFLTQQFLKTVYEKVDAKTRDRQKQATILMEVMRRVAQIPGIGSSISIDDILEWLSDTLMLYNIETTIIEK